VRFYIVIIMEVRKTDIPAKSLVNRYFPVDYKDAFVCKINHDSQLTPDDIMVRFWTDFPTWINFLFRVRNFLVKFVGLEGSMNSLQELEDCIRHGGKSKIASVPAKSDNETVLLLDDKHLDAYMSVYIDESPNNKLAYSITLVHFKNRLGRIYFFFIRPFHGLIVRSTLKNSLQ
jgi:Protein of unknown function (DUF2867).